MPGFNPMRKRDKVVDWKHEQVFEGYDPLCDESDAYDAEFHGFAYPVDEEAECDCTQDPEQPESATLCDSCLYRLTAEAA